MSTTPAGDLHRRIGLVVVVAAAVVATAWWWIPSDSADEPSQAAGPGTGATDCGPVQREPVDGAGAHVPDATYAAAPPAFGDHAPRWAVRAASFYDVGDRPAVSVLVHNLEHGYNILWYDQTVIDDPVALARVEEIANTYASLDRAPDPATAFIAAPWTAADGAAFPEGMHYALTHWYADPDDRTRSRADEVGLTRYCADIAAEVVDEWMTDHPLSAAPEGYPDLM